MSNNKNRLSYSPTLYLILKYMYKKEGLLTMNENYLNSSYERHKNDSTESLKKIISNQSKYSQEVVYAAKKILQEKENNNSSTNTQATLNDTQLSENPIVLLDSINRNINTIKNIIIVILLMSIISSIIQFIV